MKHNAWVALTRRIPEPRNCLLLVLFHSLSYQIDLAHTVLSFSVALIGRFSVPLGSYFLVFGQLPRRARKLLPTSTGQRDHHSWLEPAIAKYPEPYFALGFQECVHL